MEPPCICKVSFKTFAPCADVPVYHVVGPIVCAASRDKKGFKQEYRWESLTTSLICLSMELLLLDLLQQRAALHLIVISYVVNNNTVLRRKKNINSIHSGGCSWSRKHSRTVNLYLHCSIQNADRSLYFIIPIEPSSQVLLKPNGMSLSVTNRNHVDFLRVYDYAELLAVM